MPKYVPVFPLPNAILFPGINLPLCIFEPRYKKMLSDILKSNCMVCISLIKDGWEMAEEPFPSFTICGLGIVKLACKKADGTSNIILTGLSRVQIKKYIKYRPYIVAEIKPLNEMQEYNIDILDRATKTKELLIKRLKFERSISSEEIKYIELLDDASKLCDFVAYFSSSNHVVKQDILETVNMHDRLEKVQCILQKEIHALTIKNQ